MQSVKQVDYINSLKYMYETTNKAYAELDLPMFPYSIFYVFFYQYTYIMGVLVETACIAGGSFELLSLAYISISYFFI